jgi:uncharacterized protein YqjF (DUF2071 family)
MQLPVIEGTIARRLLVNYRADPATVAALLPAPFRPKLAHGLAVVGICLIRLEAVRPRGLPGPLGLASENAAHRIAVEWEERGETREGVYIQRRDTNSRLNTAVGGSLFPGVHHHARFTATETGERLALDIASDDGAVRVRVAGRTAEALPADSVFASLDEASAFFAGGALGYSVTRDPAKLDGLELRTRRWQVAPFTVESVASSFFDDPARFPPGTATFDCALLMRDIPHEWHRHGQFALGAQSA